MPWYPPLLLNLEPTMRAQSNPNPNPKERKPLPPPREEDLIRYLIDSGRIKEKKYKN